MGTQDSPRGTLRKTALEPLEDRVVFSAEPPLVPLGQLPGTSVDQHSSTVVDELPPPLSAADLLQHGGLSANVPPLAHQAARDADFWLDVTADRDLDILLGDVEQTLASAHNTTGLKQVRNAYGFIGTGQTVAIIDSGIAWDHVALGGGLGPNYRVVGGWDFTEENDADPYDDGPAGSHGTHVAGIVGANAKGLKDTGVAPGVDLVGLRVFNDQGEGYFSWVENALRWVHQNRNSFANPITAVNMSLGTSWNSHTIPSWAMLEDELAQLKADGIFVSVSAGNGFGTAYTTTGLSYPAASLNVVPVMSVDDNGQLSSFSQRQIWALAAPGRYITSTVPDYIGNHNGRTDDYASFSGTSMAAPYVAGASVLVREAMQFVGWTNITQDMIHGHLMATADNVYDSATGLTYKRLNLNNAISALMPADDFGSSVAAAHHLGALSGTGTATVSGALGRLDDADFFSFTATASGTVSLRSTSSDGGSQWVTSALGAFADNGGMLTFNVVAGQSYTIGLAAAAKVAHFRLDVHYTLAMEPPAPPSATETAMSLDKQLELSFAGSYSTNWGGMGEKWIRGADSKWYYITPTGAFYEWSGARNLAGSRMLAQLDASFHVNPRLLHEAASTPLALPQLAWQLDEQLGLRFTGNYSTNWGGMGEKWIRGSGNDWYFIVPSGRLYRWDGRTDLSSSTLIATLDANYHADVTRLHEATAKPLSASTVPTQSAAKQAVAASAQSLVAPQAAARAEAKHATQHTVSLPQQSTELAFAEPARDRYAAAAASVSSPQLTDYRDDAVDELFEKIGGAVKKSIGAAVHSPADAVRGS